MKNLFLLFCFIYATILSGQSNEYHKIELNKGSQFIGKIINKTNQHYWLETNLLDTFYVKRGAVNKIFLIQENNGTKGDVPVLMQGMYKSLFIGVGTGSRVTNPQWFNTTPGSFLFLPFFNPADPQLLVPQSTLLTVYKVNYAMGYQINRHFGLGMGMNLDFLRQEEALIGTIFWERANLNPYFQGKFNYPLPNWGHKDLWMTVNVFRHTEITAGMTFYTADDVYNIGLGWYKSYFSFKTENYLSLQLGLQF